MTMIVLFGAKIATPTGDDQRLPPYEPLGAAWVRPRTATCRCAGHASGLSFLGALGRGIEDASLRPVSAEERRVNCVLPRSPIEGRRNSDARLALIQLGRSAPY